MNRYIDAEWLLNFFVDIPNNFTLTIGNLRATVNDAPSVDIVHCQDCKHWNEDFILTCRRHISKVDADDFCSYGCRDSEKPNNSKERSSE